MLRSRLAVGLVLVLAVVRSLSARRRRQVDLSPIWIICYVVGSLGSDAAKARDVQQDEKEIECCYNCWYITKLFVPSGAQSTTVYSLACLLAYCVSLLQSSRQTH